MEEEEVEDEGEDGSLAYSPPVPEDLLVITADPPLIGEFLGPPGLHLRRYFLRQEVFYGHFMCVYCLGVLLGELLLVHDYVFGCC